MGKLLRVLVIIMLILSAAALTLASMLFIKREILKGRTQKLEQGLIRLARTLEAQAPEPPPTPATYPERDVSAVSAELLDNPTRGQFWSGYKQELESLDQPLVDLVPRRRELMSYYRIDQALNKPARDPITNLKITEGAGTTQGVIDYAIERAGEQYNLLTETRQQLRVTRVELVEAIRDLNDQKQRLRDRLVHIVELNNQIAQLNRTIEDLQRELRQVNERIDEQQRRINDLEQEKLALDEENEGLKIRNEEQRVRITELLRQIQDTTKPSDVTTGESGEPREELAIRRERIDIAPGAKGRVVSVDYHHLFVVMELDEVFVNELLNVTTDGFLPMIELLIYRGDEAPRFVTKVRLTQLKRERNLAIADILPDWEQMPIKEGDAVLY